MGFYGNITNASTTNLVFDRTYGSKYALMNSMKADNLFLARYALVEYEYDDSNGEVYDSFYWDGIDNTSNNIVLYRASNKKEIIKLGTEADPVYSHKALNGQADGIVLKNQIVIGKYLSKIAFFRCVGSTDDGIARFTQIVATNASVYERNQTIDKLIYNEAKGFDSTAWQKLYDSNTNEEIYLNIASLNSVVPEFQVSADPPTSLPNLPHFSANSGGVFYDLHMQPQWGFRVGQAENKDKSDEKTKWSKHSISSYGDSIVQYYYNEEEAKWQPVYSYTTEEDQMKVSADIYYNAAGFNPLVRAYDEESDNHINVLPTGSSENKYVTHGSAAGKTAKDIQELRISLPIIGNMVCKLWDLIHGENRDDSETTSLQGRLNSFNKLKENAIPVVKGNIISSGELQENTWIKPYVTTNENEYWVMVEHKDPSKENLTIIGGNDSKDNGVTLNFGEGIVLPRISYDKKGHIQSSYEFNYTLPNLSLESKENDEGEILEGEILSDLSFESVKGEGKFTKTYSYVGDLSLKGYDLADFYEDTSLSKNDNVNTAFAKLQYQINTKTSSDDAKFGAIDQSINNVNERINNLDYIDTVKNNEYVSAVSQEDGTISVLRAALPEIYNSSTTFEYAENNQKTIGQWFELVKELEGKVNTLETQLASANNQITNLNNTITNLTVRIEALENSVEETPPVEEGGEETPTE